MRARLFVVTTLLLAGCKPDLGQPTSLVAERRILAIKSEPAETRPGQNVTYAALVVSPLGTETAPALSWALCMTPKPLDENNIVTTACLDDGPSLSPFGSQTPSQRSETASVGMVARMRRRGC